MTAHVATIAAYPIKDELGGGFRGVMLVVSPKVRHASDRFETLEQAKFWAKTKAHETYEEAGYSLAPFRRKGEYQANVWANV